VAFLICYRRIIEGNASDEAKLKQLRALPSVSAQFADYWRRLQKAVTGFPIALFYGSLCQLVRADPNLSHRADRILSRGGKPTF
jgi:hypothetical protein